MYKRLICEQGSVLLSTFHLLLFVSFLIISLTSIVRLQVMQLQQISFSYEAKALIEMSEKILKEDVGQTNSETGRIIFREGTVDVKKETDTVYTLTATLPNQYTSRSTLEILRPAEEEVQEIERTDDETEADATDNEHGDSEDTHHTDPEQDH